jgi:pimeloyl-ACP methyl ester carboxylesterase
VAETSYAKCGDLSLAYQIFGDGPVELVWAGSFTSHVELFWTMPEFGSLMEQLGTFARVLLFDKAGTGLSDPVPRIRTLDERAAEIEAVMDAVGFGRAALVGVSEGGPAAILFAATRPERTRALILSGTAPYSFVDGWDDFERDPAELRARLVRELGEDYVPSVEWIARYQEVGRAIRSAWGSGAALRSVVSGVRSTRLLGMLERMSASPGMALGDASRRGGRRRATAVGGCRMNGTHITVRGPGRCTECSFHVKTQGHPDGCSGTAAVQADQPNIDGRSFCDRLKARKTDSRTFLQRVDERYGREAARQPVGAPGAATAVAAPGTNPAYVAAAITGTSATTRYRRLTKSPDRLRGAP